MTRRWRFVTCSIRSCCLHAATSRDIITVPIRGFLPATWTLGTELYFYLLIGLVTARSKGATIAFCLAALGATAALGILLRWEPAWLTRWMFPRGEEVPRTKADAR